MTPARSRFGALKQACLRSLRKSGADEAERKQALDWQGAVVRRLPTSLRPDETERRRTPRYKVGVSVTFTSEHNFYQGFSENLSEGGLFIATHALKPIGSLLDIGFTLPGCAETLTARGRVCWVRELSDSSLAPAGMGVQFTELDGAAIRLVREFIRRRQPVFFPD